MGSSNAPEGGAAAGRKGWSRRTKVVVVALPVIGLVLCGLLLFVVVLSTGSRSTTALATPTAPAALAPVATATLPIPGATARATFAVVVSPLRPTEVTRAASPPPTILPLPRPTSTGPPGGSPPAVAASNVPAISPPSVPPAATSSPTLAPTSAPAQTATTSPARVLTGHFEATFPPGMVIEESDVVALVISPDQQLASLGFGPGYNPPALVSIQTKSQTQGRSRIEDKIRLYPVMTAELVAANFEVTGADLNNRRRAVAEGQSAAWTWNISPRKTGDQSITINIYGETTVGGERLTVLEKSDSETIRVADKPLAQKTQDWLANNYLAVLGTGGPIGVILMWLSYRASKENKAK